MDNQVENIVTLSNIMTVTKTIFKKVGFEMQAPIDDATLDEIISSAVLDIVGKLDGASNV